MKIITVTPIHKGIFRENLSYFSAEPVALGAIITVPLRRGTITALVTGVTEAEQERAQLRQLDFPLKKIGAVKAQNFFLPAFITAAREVSAYHLAPLGSVLKSLVPQKILDRAETTKTNPPKTPLPETTLLSDIHHYRFVLQAENDERIAYYKSLIRESFAKKHSVFLCLPGQFLVEKMAAAFDKGIGDYTIILHPGLTPTELQARWRQATEENHPILVIATPLFLSLPRPDLGTIIFDQENSDGYQERYRPFLDFRRFGEILARETGARIIYGDLILRTETIFRTEKGELTPLTPLKYRAAVAAEQILVSGRPTGEGSKTLAALQPEICRAINDAILRRQKIVIVCGRKGLAPTTVCSDCGTVIHCDRCQGPLVIHSRPKKTKEDSPYVYLCHKCGTEKEIDDLCPHCGSWRLSLLGFGLDRVEEELAELFPTLPRFKHDRDAVKNPTRSKEMFAKFFKQKGPALLAGTESVLPFIEEKIDTIAVIGFDSLFTLPDFRISEKMFNILLNLRAQAVKRFLIQTRNPDEKVWGYALRGEIIDFYREEIEERMRFGYPPFRRLIKISQEGKQEVVEKTMAALAQELATWSPLVFPAFAADSKNRYRLQLILKLPPDNWPEPKLATILRSLSPNFSVEVEPDSIL